MKNEKASEISIDKEYLKEIGKRFKRFRESLGLKQKELADHMGMSGSLISQIENGYKNPGFEVLHILMQKYRISLDWLYYGEGEMILKDGSLKVEGEARDIKVIRDIPDLVWLMEYSHIFKHNIMGYALEYFYKHEEGIMREVRRFFPKKEKKEVEVEEQWSKDFKPR